jgi:type II secretory pathway component GspD/PulD (secretin)
MNIRRFWLAFALVPVALVPTSVSADWFEFGGVVKEAFGTPDVLERPLRVAVQYGLKAVPQQAKSATQGNPATPTPVPQTTPVPAQTPPPQPAPQPQAGASKVINNVFAGTDIREAISEVASAAGITIIPDESIKATPIYIEFRNEPIDSAIQKLALLVGAFVKEREDGVYLLSQANPDSSLFREFSATRNYVPQNLSAPTLQALLPPNYKPFVQADAKSNLITVTAPEQLLPHIIRDIQTIDAPPRQFVVEALVAELTNDNGRDFGFSWSWKNFAVGDDLGLSYARAGFDDVAKLKALITTNQATLRANPRLTAFEGRESNLIVGQETYYSLLTGNIQYPTAQIQLIKTGVTLNFTGYISEDGSITLNLAPEVSDAVVNVNGNPTTNVRRVSTMVRVRPGETIAIGGLIQQTTSHNTSRVPILGNIPLLGELFTQRTNTSHRSEVIILITPRMTDEGVGTKGLDSDRKLPPP